MARVVRAGEAKAVDLARGYQEHLGAPGLYGFPVQYQAGVPWQELARAGQYPNAQVSIAEEEDLRAALQSLGYDLRLISDNVDVLSVASSKEPFTPWIQMPRTPTISAFEAS